jgi:hypothetical protein
VLTQGQRYIRLHVWAERHPSLRTVPKFLLEKQEFTVWHCRGDERTAHLDGDVVWRPGREIPSLAMRD